MTVFIKIGVLILNIIYFFFKLFPQQNKVTLISRQSDHPTPEFRMIEECLWKKDPNVRTVMLCKTLSGGIHSKLWTKVKYGFHIFRQMYHLATSKVVILDSYCIPASILKHKKSLRIVQMWHSMGTMKKFGYTAVDKFEGSNSNLADVMRMHKNYDYIFASSEAYKQHLADAFRCDIKKIITMPLPRLDLLKSKEYEAETRNTIYSAYPQLKEKKVILYCPTFRKDEKDLENAVHALAANVDFERYHLVVKLHPLSKTKLHENIILAKEFSTFDLIFTADYVISDYSCVVYEAAVRNIPLYFYNFDIDHYLESRGLAIDYFNELPGVISKDPKEIFEAIENEQYDMQALKAFSNKYVEPVDDATEKIANFTLKLLNEV